MPDPKSVDWQISDFVEGDWVTAIQEIKKIREFVRKMLDKDKKYHENFGAHLDLFNNIATPHEHQRDGHFAPAGSSDALQIHQKGVFNLMAEGSEVWNLWSAWKEKVWEEYKKLYSRRASLNPTPNALYREWTRVCMNGQTFSSARDFRDFSFPNETSFDEAIFSSTANFGGASFQKTSFDNAVFSSTVNFYQAEFAQSTSFNGATFSDNVEFCGATFERAPSFVGATFSKDFQFDHSYSFCRASTERNNSNGVSFPMQADFTSATFSQEVRFINETFPDEAKFSGATFAGGASFRGAEFHDTANFAGAKFRHKADFGRSTFKNEANFENAVFTSETSFINTKFEHPPVFHGAELHPSTAFAPGLELWDQFENLDEEGARDRFRTLKNHFKNQEAQFEANLFYALEMRATMHEEWKAGKWWRAALIWVYDGFTAFGLSVFRPFFWWLVVLLSLTIILVLLSFANLGLINSVISSFSLAFLNSLALPGFVDSNLFASQIATVFQIEQPSVYATMLEFSRRFPGVAFALGLAKVLSVGFIFLTLLALRNRFRIK